MPNENNTAHPSHYFEQLRDAAKTFRKMEVPETIYHYTSIYSALSIIENQSLWLSDAKYLNDSNEICIAYDIMDRIKNKSNEEYVKEIQTSKDIDVINSFIMSFCRSDNSLYQWMTYGNNGVAIGFDSKKLLDGNTFDTANLNLRNMIYDEDEAETAIKEWFSKAFELWLSAGSSLPKSAACSIATVAMVQFSGAFIKHKHFSPESEVRLAYSSDMRAEKAKIMSFRERNGLLLPHVKCNVKNENLLPITGIVLSPTSNPLNAKSFKKLMKQKGYEDINIKSAESSYRG